MKRLGALALIAGLFSASCSGHSGSSLIPAAGGGGGQPSTLGTHTVRQASMLAAPTGWATTGTLAVTPASASDLGVLPATQTLTIHAVLQLRSVDQLKSAVAQRQIVPRGTFMTTYAPTSDQVAQVKSYLQAQGFSNVVAAPNNLLVSATGTAASVAKAFNTEIHGFAQNGATVFANTQPAYVPQALAGTVIAILGLNNAQAAAAGPHKTKPTPTPLPTATPVPTPTPVPATPTPSPTPTPTPAPVADSCTVNAQGLCPRFYDPDTFELAYDASGMPAATGTSVAIMTEGQLSGAIADFRQNETAFNLPQEPVTIVPVEPMSSDTGGNDEWTLDMTYSQALAGNVKQLYLYNFASLADSDIVLGFNKWVTDDVAQVGNSSFGGCEAFPYQDGAMLAADEILVEAASQGQTMFVSTGDTGGFCGIAGVPPNGGVGGAPLIEWPAASPYVVAVGGTDLFSNPDGTYLGEDAWQSGGGGISQFEYSPYWESPTQPIGTTAVGYSFRGVPDIAMDAGLETGAELYTSGSAANGSCTPCITGGTSLASPLAAGAYARIQSAHGNAIGFGAPAFYSISMKNASPSQTSGGPPPTQLVGGFHDVLTGTNGDYTAAPRFDYTTGMGSLDVVKTNAQL